MYHIVVRIDAKSQYHIWWYSNRFIGADKLKKHESLSEVKSIELIKNKSMHLEKSATKSLRIHIMYLDKKYVWNHRIEISFVGSVEHSDGTPRPPTKFSYVEPNKVLVIKSRMISGHRHMEGRDVETRLASDHTETAREYDVKNFG